MSESPVNTESEKEPKTFTAGASASDDTEAADHGYVFACTASAARIITDVELLGGAIGAGLFVGSGSALQTGGPGSLVCHNSVLTTILQSHETNVT
jgi:amino acid transporter